MARELNVKGLVKLTGATTLIARIEKADQIIANHITLTESEDMQGYFSGDMPADIPADEYDVTFIDTGTPVGDVVAIGKINWDGEKEVNEEVALENAIIKNRNWNFL